MFVTLLRVFCVCVFFLLSSFIEWNMWGRMAGCLCVLVYCIFFFYFLFVAIRVRNELHAVRITLKSNIETDAYSALDGVCLVRECVMWMRECSAVVVSGGGASERIWFGSVGNCFLLIAKAEELKSFQDFFLS